jgi:[ribosomal protein S5]-alanine N-acetyltransferase
MPELTTTRLTLRPVTEGDLATLLHLRNQAAVLGTTVTGDTLPADRMRRQLDRWLAQWQALGTATWIVELKERPVAYVALDPMGEGYDGVDPDDLELGVIVHPDYWGQGIAGEAALAVANDCFTRVGLSRLYATVDDSNARSLAAIAKHDNVELVSRAEDGELLYRLLTPRRAGRREHRVRRST